MGAHRLVEIQLAACVHVALCKSPRDSLVVVASVVLVECTQLVEKHTCHGHLARSESCVADDELLMPLQPPPKVDEAVYS